MSKYHLRNVIKEGIIKLVEPDRTVEHVPLRKTPNLTFVGVKLGVCFVNYLLSVLFAERAGFEPAVPFRGTHAFQACQFSHSCISPKFMALFFQGCKVRKKLLKKLLAHLTNQTFIQVQLDFFLIQILSQKEH